MGVSRRSVSLRILGLSAVLALVVVAAWGASVYGVPAAKPESATEVKAEEAYGKTHPCTGAGTGKWFPADPEVLRKGIEAAMSGEAVPIARPPVALIVPHAGYQYSGAVAGRAFATLKGRTYKRVILMGPSHPKPQAPTVRGASVLHVESYETPLGSIPVDAEVRDALLKSPLVSEQPAAHKNEHSVENQLPFLQVALKNFKMAEVLVGEMSASDRTALADVLRPLVDDQTLLVVSSDFTHYGPNHGYQPFKWRVPENLRELNDRAVRELVEVDLPGWDAYLDQTHDTICGARAIGLALQVLAPWDDVQALQTAYDTSGRQTGDYTNSVTYDALVFWRTGAGLTEAEQKTLLKLARDAAEGFLKTGKVPALEAKAYDLTPALKAPGAAFVTLKNKGELRGCIGDVTAMMPLYLSVVENSCRACVDRRFTSAPVTAKEAPNLAIEISVLSAMRRLMDPQKVQVGRDGLVMVRGAKRGLLLPQVPGEQGWDREKFLAESCLKAGLAQDAWKDSATEIYRFSAQVFGEEKAAEKKPEAEKKPDEKKVEEQKPAEK